MTDLKAKMLELLAECDLLIVPRMTLRNVTCQRPASRSRLYRLDDAQVEAVKEFLKAGKPVLACFGPTNEPADRAARRRRPGRTASRSCSSQLGIQFGKQTVLFDADSKSFAERRTNLFATGSTNEAAGAVRAAGRAAAALYSPGRRRPSRRAGRAAAGQPDRPSMAVAEPQRRRRSELDLAAQAPAAGLLRARRSRASRRPSRGSCSPTRTAGTRTSRSRRASGRRASSRPSRTTRPRARRDEKRRGPFPVGVAVETTVPAEWMTRGRPPRRRAWSGRRDEATPTALAAEGWCRRRYAPAGYKPTRCGSRRSATAACSSARTCRRRRSGCW